MSLLIKSYPPVAFSGISHRIWPTDCEKINRLAFTDDGSHGAFLVGPFEFKLFAIDREDDNLITIKDVHTMECPTKYKQITAMKFGPVRGSYRGQGIFAAPLTSTEDPNLQVKAHLFATSHVDKVILLWDTTGQYVTVLNHHHAPITDLVFTPRKFGLIQLMSVDLDGALLVWDFEFNQFQNLCQAKTHQQGLHCVAWADGGHLVATAGIGMIVYVYRMGGMKIGKKIHELRGHLSCVVSCQFTADATTLISASLDTRVNLWDCLTGELRQTICHAYPVPQLIFDKAQIRSMVVTRFGSTVVTITEDNNLRIWDPLQDSAEVEHPPVLPFRAAVPARPLKVNPELTIELDDNNSQYSVSLSKGGHWIGVSSVKGDSFTIFEIQRPVPTLATFCRNATRQALASHLSRHIVKEVKNLFIPNRNIPKDTDTSDLNGVDRLPVPKVVKDFLNYDHQSVRDHFHLENTA